MLCGQQRDDGGIELVPLSHGLSLTPSSRMRVEGIIELMSPLVGLRIRIRGGAKCCHPNDISLDIEAVFRVVQQRDTEFCRREIDPFLRNDLTTVSRTIDRGKRNVTGNLVRRNRERKCNLEQPFTVMPVRVKPKIDLRA